jgi:hypothetical protein
VPDVRETIVRLDYDGDFAEVWTERRSLVVRLQALGFAEVQRQGRGVWLRGGIRQVAFKKPPAVGTSARREASLKALAKAREARSQSRAGSA